MKYLVLGSAGQIGSTLVKKIKENKKDEVFEFDIENNPSQDLRIYNNKLLDKIIKKSDFIFFLAFDVGGSRYLKTYQDTYDFVSNNIKIVDRTFDALKKHNKPFIFASSQMANMSYSSYGLLKSVGEKNTEILGGLVVKFWNVYGLEHDKNKFHVITDLIIRASTTGKINLLTDGTEERQLLFTDDCAECLIELSKKYKNIPRNKQLHITNFKWHTILDVANIISKHFPGSKIKPSKQIDTVQKNKKNEPDSYILSYWKPKTKLEDGIAYIIKEMKAHPEKYPGMSSKKIL
ncbi:MAG: NAD(P)-dependent oxidoreductase [Minisyncoccia bacterium]